ncbi:unnamed protein product [Mucor circinelloides]
MGLLKLGSLYKKKSKKDTLPPPVPAPVAPKLIEPISLELNLDLNNSSSIHDTRTIATTTLPQQQRNTNNTPAGSGSLFDDIFSELTTSKPVAQQDAMQNDISLAVALSQQLQLEETNSTNRMTGTAQKGSNTVSSSSNKNEASSSNVADFLLGGDSIYSSYLRNISALDHEPSNSTFSTSMFDNLLGNNKQTTATTTTTTTTTTPAAASNNSNANVPIATKVVLDSDISDSDEDSKNDSEDDNSSQLLNYDGNQRMTRGVRPIMERRTQDNRLLVQRKIDNWANRVDPEANQVESNESMINRMKDRHRNQVKMAALRQQQQDQQQQHPQYSMMPHHMVAQPYGPAAIPLSPNVVLPHPGMLMDPAQMYYSTPINDYPETPGSNTQLHQSTPPPPPPVPLPSGFLPNPSHATLAIPHKDKEDKNDQHVATAAAAERPFPTQSYSTPTSSGRPKPSRSPPAVPSAEIATFSVTSTSADSSNVNINAQTQEPSPASSSVTLQSSLPTDVEDEASDDKSVIVESPVKEHVQPSTIEDETIGAEADAESSDDEERKSVILRKKKSMKKLRQKQQGSVDGSDTNHRQIRSSRSAPNLKKKQSSKKMSKSTSRSSSRRNSQETCTPPSELISTPPPLPSNYEEEHHYHLPRSYSHQQMHPVSSPPPPLPSTQQQQQQQHYHHHPQQQNRQYQRQSLRHMKSEPELPRRSQYLPAQQQQLNNEWERMQVHQREQQLKKQYLQSGHNNSLPAISTSHHPQQPMPYMPMYSTPVYYPSMPPSMMPYSAGSGMDAYNSAPPQQQQQQDAAHRASMMSSYYQQPQGYYHPSHR